MTDTRWAGEQTEWLDQTASRVIRAAHIQVPSFISADPGRLGREVKAMVVTAMTEAAARATDSERERWLAMLREPSEAMAAILSEYLLDQMNGPGDMAPLDVFARFADAIEAEAQLTAGEETGDG